MGRPKVRRKKKSAGKIKKRVRLLQHEALHLMNLIREGSVEEGEMWLRALRPELSVDERWEVAIRCGDPAKWGGVTTGTDPSAGEYADIAIKGDVKRPL